MTKETLCTYEQAIGLKRLGFDKAMSAALDKAIFCARIINHNNK